MLYSKRTDYPQLITPKGKAVWPALNEPDFNYKEEFGEYHAKLRIPVDSKELAKFRKPVEDLLEKAYQAKVEELKADKKAALAKKLVKVDPFKPEEDPETGEETGYILIRASMNAGGRRKKDDKVFKMSPDFFNRTGKTLKNPPQIGGGSELKLGVRLRDYYFAKDKEIGVSFDLEAVQVLTAESFGGNRSAEDYGFGEEDGDDIDDGNPGFTEEDGDDIEDDADLDGDF